MLKNILAIILAIIIPPGLLGLILYIIYKIIEKFD